MSATDVQALLRPPLLDECKKVLCVQPHPDDNEIGMGGIIRMLAEQGCEIHYLTVTDGRLGNMGLPHSPEEIALLRKKEAKDAGTFLGATQFFWFGYEDGTLSDIPRLAKEVATLIRTEQYDAVFTPDPWLMYESHYDHIVTGRACAQAAISCSLVAYPEGTDTRGCTLQAVGFYFTSKPNTVVDITEYFEAKFQAMALHETQMHEELLTLYRSYFTLTGKQLLENKGIGEALKMLRPIHLHAFAHARDI